MPPSPSPPPSSSGPRIIFLNRCYWPEEAATAQLLTDLAEGLAARGKTVTVVTGRPAATPARERRRGVAIARVGRERGPRGSLVAKTLDYGAYFLAALRLAGRVARPGDILIALTDPPLIGLGAARLARRRQLQLCHWIQDIYPEIVLALTGRRELAVFRPARDRAWRQAAACVTLGADMASVVAAAGVVPAKIHIVPNWTVVGAPVPAEADVAALRQSWGLDGKTVVAYSGNLGRVHDFDAVLAVAAALASDPQIVFLIVGEGPQRAALEAEAARRQLRHMQFRPAQPRSAVATTLAAADIHLVTLRSGCESYVFPSKLYGAAAAGRPVLFIGPPQSEPARIIAHSGFGRAFPPDQTEAIARFITELRGAPALRAQLGAAARAFSAASLDAAGAAEAWSAIFDQLAPAQPALR